MAPRPVVYSYSRLKCFEKCEEQYALRYVRRQYPNLDSVERFLGVLVHQVVEKVHTRELEQRLSTCLEYLMDQWSTGYDPLRHYDVRDYGENYWRDHAIRCVNNFFRTALPTGDEVQIDIETSESMPLLETPMCSFRGILDRKIEFINGVYEIHDFKTGKRQPLKYFKKDQQLPLYAHMVARRHEIPADHGIEVRRYYLATGEVDGFRVTEALRAAAWRWAVKVAMDAIVFEEELKGEQREAQPHLGPLCNWCDYKRAQLCRAHAEDFVL